MSYVTEWGQVESTALENSHIFSAAALPRLDDANVTRIVSIGELGGGTEYFGRDNLLGFYAWMKERVNQNKTPDHIIFHGEAFPEIPKYITRGGMDKSFVLADFINNVDTGVVAIKPHLSRITDLIKDKDLNTKITYVMNTSDANNIKREYDLLVTAFNYNPVYLIEEREKYKEKTGAATSIIENLQTSKKKNLEELENAEGRLEEIIREKEPENWNESDDEVYECRKKITHIEEKLSQRKDELKDYVSIYDGYTNLVKFWIKNNGLNYESMVKKAFKGAHNSGLMDMVFEEFMGLVIEVRGEKSLDEIMEQLNRGLTKVRTEMEEVTPEENGDKFDALEAESKRLANLITKFSHENIEEGKKEAERGHTQVLEQSLRFTHNIPGDPYLAKLSREIAKNTITTGIRDAFGRRIKINIVETNYSDLNVNGLRVRVTNKPSNSSETFAKNNKNLLNYLLRVQKKDCDVIIGAKSPSATVRVVPSENMSEHYVYQLTSAPCIDLAGLQNAWNAKKKTWVTEVIGKHNPSSGFDELKYDGKSFKHSFYTSESLTAHADREKLEQIPILVRMLQASTAEDIIYKKLEGKELLYFSNKLPSELNQSEGVDKLLHHLGVDPNNNALRAELAEHIGNLNFNTSNSELEKAMEWFKTYLSPKENQRSPFGDKVDFVALTDTHTGSPGTGYPNRLAIDGFVRYVKENVKDRYILCLLGDNVEGGLRNHKNELNEENDAMNIHKYELFLEQRKGINKSSERFAIELNEYIAWLHFKTPMQSYDNQFDSFVLGALPLIEGAEATAIASGNHYNKSIVDKSSTEAGGLQSRIESKIPEHKRENIKAYFGGDWGYGSIPIEDGPTFRISHKADPELIINKLRAPEPITLGGDIHEHTSTIIGNKAVYTGLALQGITKFPATVGIPASESLRGISMFSMAYDEQLRPLVFTDTFVSIKELKQRGYLRESPFIKEFESTRDTIRFNPTKILVYS